MRLAPSQRRAYSYNVTVPVDVPAVTLDNVKSHLKITSSSEDVLLTIYLNAAIDFAEKFTRRDFITRTYETFRDFFPGMSEGYYQFGQNQALGSLNIGGGNVGFEIRRSPLQSIEKIEYLVSDVLTLVDSSIYYNTLEADYSEVLTKESGDWPEDADSRLQAITITFKSGFGDEATDMPAWVTEGILQHVAEMYSNRGDCDFSGGVDKFLPVTARLLYMHNRIENL